MQKSIVRRKLRHLTINFQRRTSSVRVCLTSFYHSKKHRLSDTETLYSTRTGPARSPFRPVGVLVDWYCCSFCSKNTLIAQRYSGPAALYLRHSDFRCTGFIQSGFAPHNEKAIERHWLEFPKEDDSLLVFFLCVFLELIIKPSRPHPWSSLGAQPEQRTTMCWMWASAQVLLITSSNWMPLSHADRHFISEEPLSASHDQL